MPQDVPMTTLTDADFQRFHELAPQVLKNRTPGYYWSELDNSVHYILAGVIPILGVAFWGWSATNWMVFLVIGCWMGFLCDLIRLRYLSKEIDAYCERVVDDTFVSVVSEALRAEKDQVISDYLPRKPDYGGAAIVDLIFCTVSTIAIFVSLPKDLNSQVFGRDWFWPTLIAFLSYRLGMTIWEIIGHRVNPQRKPVVKVAFGLRAFGMFIVLFVVGVVCGGPDPSGRIQFAVYFVNGAQVAWGLLNMYGIVLILGERRWLQKYLAARKD